jgi:hypothetical protein
MMVAMVAMVAMVGGYVDNSMLCHAMKRQCCNGDLF